ncbi:DDE family transposase [Actinomadura pelletieri DSM 43383]|uniref:DDE family transposase n=1 Tax=Actinomadura pelletieri DSM 43383 TaxID=1120940 RepID=A0A495Q9A5_9ACTN|nr:DDE family transposase [Actinomadura pelletieri DSM 43383]
MPDRTIPRGWTAPAKLEARSVGSRSRRGPRRRRPGKLHADPGYDSADLRLRRRGIGPRIARRGIEASNHLGQHRWVVERTASWLNGLCRLHRRYERKPEYFLAFVGVAAALICHRQLTKRDDVEEAPSPMRAEHLRQCEQVIQQAGPSPCAGSTSAARAGRWSRGTRPDDHGRLLALLGPRRPSPR